MKKNYFVVTLLLIFNFTIGQVQSTSYRGAFAPAPAPMWTTGWTNFDPQNAVYGTTNVQVSSDVTSNTRWTKNNVYQLNGLIIVRNNATLTIEAGTVIRSAEVASALLITRGSKLVANGSVSEPIIFTSNKAIGSRARGDWGGIVMLGKARYNINNGVNFIEGLTQNAITEFGGGLTPDNNDNSGVLRFVRIEYAGFVFSPNNELNGLTMGAVGKGTTIENVQVSYSNDDSFEWFGGSVNCKNLVAFAGLDDDFDVDNGYTGTVQFGLAVKDPLAADISTSEIFEVDNNSTPSDTNTQANPWADFTSGIFSNITAIGPNARPNGSGTFVTPSSLHDRALRLRRNSRLNIYNSIFIDSRRGLHIETLSSSSAYVADLARFKNNTIAGQSLANAFAFPQTTSSSIPTTAEATAWFNSVANANTLNTASAGILAKAYNGTDATNYKLVGEAVTATSIAEGAIDYRPLSATGADFTDSKLSGLIVASGAPGVTPTLQYCKGVVAPALTANLTSTGVSLKWYAKPVTFRVVTVVGAKDVLVTNPDLTQTITVNGGADILAQVVDAPILVGGVAASNNLVPATTTVGKKSYFVAEVDANGVESQRSRIDVTTTATPTVALGTITSTVTEGGATATAAVGNYIGTATQLTYTVPASSESSVKDYLWTVPAGVNIIARDTIAKTGQGFNKIVVNFANVPAGVFKVGNVSVQARNAELCGGAIKTLALTAALPAAPAAIVLNDGTTKTNAAGLTSNVSITSFAKYMGTDAPLTIVATPVVGAQGYIWELPTGVNITTQTTVVSDVTRFYNLFPFVAISALTTAPTTGGNVFYEIRTITYTDGTSVATGRLRQNARAATGGLPAITARNIELTNATNEGAVINPAYPIVRSTSNVLTVNFAGVTSGNTFNFNTNAATPVSTNSMRIGVKSFNGVGASVTLNTTASNPATSSTAKLLTLSAIRPAAPKVTGPVAALCPNVSYTYTITPSPLASSYAITAPDGSVVTTAGNLTNTLNTLSTSSLTFSVVYPAGFLANTTTSLKTLNVNAVNGIGVSTLASVTKLSTLVPAVGTVTSSTGSITTFNQGLTAKVFTVATNPLFTGYNWTASNGAVITAGQGTSSITVDFSGVQGTTTTTRSVITVSGETPCGASIAKVLTLSYNAAATRLRQDSDVNATEVYPNPVAAEFNIDVTAATAGTFEFSIYSLDGALIVSPKSVQIQEGANTITENVSNLKSGIYVLRLVNATNNEIITKKLIKM